MGGGQKHGRSQRKHFRQNRENVWKKTRPDPSSTTDNNNSSSNNNNNPPWEPFATHNPAFEEYYKEQQIVSEEEWDEFLCVLRKPLPAAFRINSSGQFFEDIRSQLENDFMKSLNTEFKDESGEDAIRPLPWYPENLAWHSNFSRMQLRKNQTLERFHEFLKQENEIGNITRQEAVSMVPPLFLDVRSDHCVLDMCAAPGSKTFQLLEIIHQATDPASLPAGMVIANDVDFRRCNLLIHQTKRMCSANLIVTNHEAQHFPSCHFNSSILSTSKIGVTSGPFTGIPVSYEESNEPRKRQLLFDRILCDVPCSGDGTLRKAPDIWRKWNAGMGNGLHRLQVQIAMRGIALLKVGGRMVYSTCSMNPVEDEAVVGEILRRSGGSVELLDVSAELPQLVRRPGLKTWKVRDKGLWLASYKDVPTYRKSAIVQSMFPSSKGWESEETFSKDDQDDVCLPADGNKEAKNGCNMHHDLTLQLSKEPVTPSDFGEAATELERSSNDCTLSKDLKIENEEVSSFPLERCMRILPHDQNGGAFFIAVLHKISPLKAVPEKQRANGYSSNKKFEFKRNLSIEKIEDKCDLEKKISEDETGGNDVDLAEVALDADFQNKQESSILVEIASEVDHDAIYPDSNELEDSKACNGAENGPKSIPVKSGLQIQGKWRGVDPVVFFMDDNTINSIRSFYGIDESFPFNEHLVTRNSDVHHVKRIYYISDSVRDILHINFQVGQQLKITSLGLKVFERQTSKEASSPCAFRISSEGLPLLLPYITKQIICAPIKDFEHLLRYRSVKFADFVDAGVGEKASNLMSGCCIVVLHKGDGPVSDAIMVDNSTIAIGCWKGKTNLTVMVSQMESLELLERLAIRFGRQNVSASPLQSKHATSEAEAVEAIEEDDTMN